MYNRTMERYEILKDTFTQTEFNIRLTAKIETLLSTFGYTQDEVTTIKNTLVTPIAYIIYDYYSRDRLAYSNEDEDYKTIFFDRLGQQLSIKIPTYIVRFNFQKILDENSPDRYDVTSHMESSSQEKGLSGSSVIQSSASTPTGVSTETTSSQVTITKNEDTTSANVDIQDNEYSSKYTSFQAKTNGVHDNDVTREGDVKRRGGLLDIINLVNNLPQEFFEVVLKDVSKHFLFVY